MLNSKAQGMALDSFILAGLAAASGMSLALEAWGYIDTAADA